MLRPTIVNFNKQTQGQPPCIIYASGSPAPHPNPKLYKYLWQVFTPELGLEGDAFFEQAPVLSTARYYAHIEKLIASGQSGMVYGFRRPRCGPGSPIDPLSEKWRAVEFAPSWDNDPDPIFEGHK